MTTNTPVAVSRHRARGFYVGLAIAIAVTVFAGFSRSYFLKAYFGTAELSPLLHVHGLVFTCWVLLFLAQTSLVAVDRVDLHRRLGVGGAVLAGLLLIVGTTTAILRVKGGSAPMPGVPPLAFLAVPLFDMVVFAILAGSGLSLRRNRETHKRLMALATISLMSAPIARLPLGVLQAGPVAFFGLTDLFIVAMLTYDFTTLRKAHPATAWGGLLIVASQPLRLMISSTAAWLAFAGWLTR
jgi:hypothetical protein